MNPTEQQLRRENKALAEEIARLKDALFALVVTYGRPAVLGAIKARGFDPLPQDVPNYDQPPEVSYKQIAPDDPEGLFPPSRHTNTFDS